MIYILIFLSLYQVYPALVPQNGTAEWEEFNKIYTLEPGKGRTQRQQALWQLCTLGVTIGISLVGGMLTGEIFIFPFCHFTYISFANNVIMTINVVLFVITT